MERREPTHHYADCPMCLSGNICEDSDAFNPEPWKRPEFLEQVRQGEARMMRDHRLAETTNAVRRYLLVMLLALLGGMIGGVASGLTILHYYN